MKNWKILEQIINDLPLSENEIVIAREDGLYLTEKKDDYKHVNDNEICISKSEDTVESLIDSFNNIHTIERHDCLPMDYHPDEI